MVCSIHFEFALFPSLASTQIVANEVELVAITAITSVLIPLVSRYAIHLCLHQWGILKILAVGAATTTGFFLVHLHGLAKRDPVDLVGCGFIAGVLWAEHPVVDHHLGVLLVLGCGDEFILDRQAHEALGHHHEFVHAVSPLSDFAARGANGQRGGCACC